MIIHYLLVKRLSCLFLLFHAEKKKAREPKYSVNSTRGNNEVLKIVSWNKNSFSSLRFFFQSAV